MGAGPYAGIVDAVGSADRGAAAVAEIQAIGHSLDSRPHDRRRVRHRARGGGRRVWALVLQVLAQRIAELVIGWIAVPVRFGLTWSAPHFHELRPVALNVFGARIMTMMNGQLPRLVLGFTLGPTDVGLFALGSRFHDIIVTTMAVPRTAVGRIELRAEKIGSAEFQRDFVTMVQNASILSFPFFLGTAALAPSLFHLWLKQQWQAGIVPAQLIVLGGVPMVLFYSFDAALLAGNLSSVVRRIATLQAVTVAATVLCAAPFGLIATCLALAVRPWLLLPVVFMNFRRATNIPGRIALLPVVRPLIGAVMMAGLLSLPFPHPTWMNAALEFALRVIAGIMFYFSYLYFLSPEALSAIIRPALGLASPAVGYANGCQKVMNGAMPRWCYWVSGFFLLDTMQAFGVMSRIVYGGWPGKTGDHITQTLNVMMIVASLTLFGISCRRTRRALPRAASWPSRRSGSCVCPPFGHWTRRRPSASPPFTFSSSLA